MNLHYPLQWQGPISLYNHQYNQGFGALVMMMMMIIIIILILTLTRVFIFHVFGIIKMDLYVLRRLLICIYTHSRSIIFSVCILRSSNLPLSVSSFHGFPTWSRDKAHRASFRCWNMRPGHLGALQTVMATRNPDPEFSTWDVMYKTLYLKWDKLSTSTGAGFQPSTVGVSLWFFG